MGLFGLGDFGTGFVEGFAKSANEALKEDLKKVDLRVEKVAEAKMKRALKEQEERAEELEEIEEAIKQGEQYFGTGPQATQFAASLLKKEGNVSAYKSMLEKMRDRSFQTGQTDFSSYFTQDGIVLPEVKKPEEFRTAKELSVDFLGKPKTTSTEIPDEATIGAGRLLSSIGLDQDIKGQITQRVKEDFAARDLIAPTDITINPIPSITFDSESFVADGMDSQQKLKFYGDKLADPKNKSKREFYQSKILGIEKSIAETGGIDDQIAALKMTMSRQTGPEKEATAIKIAKLNRQKNLSEANSSGNPMEVLKARAANELADAFEKNPTDPDLSTFRNLNAKIADMESPPTFETLVGRENDEFLLDVKKGDLVPGTDEYTKRRLQLQTNAKIKDSLPKDIKLSPSLISTQMGIMDKAIVADLAKSMPKEEYKEFYELKKLVDKNPDFYSSTFTDLQRAVYDRGMEQTQTIRKSAIKRVLDGLKPTGGFDTYPEAWVAANNLGFSTVLEEAQKTSDAVDTSAASSTSAVTSGTDNTVSAIPTKPAKSETYNKYTAKIPDNTDTAAKMLQKILDDPSRDLNEVIKEFKDVGYSKSFLSVLGATSDEDTNQTLAQESARKTVGAEINKVIDIINNTSGFASKEIRKIAKEITNGDKKRAEQLYRIAKQEIDKKNNVKKVNPKFKLTQAQIDASPDATYNTMGKRAAYKKINGKFYEIKRDGSISKSPVNSARQALLNRQAD